MLSFLSLSTSIPSILAGSVISSATAYIPAFRILVFFARYMQKGTLPGKKGGSKVEIPLFAPVGYPFYKFQISKSTIIPFSIETDLLAIYLKSRLSEQNSIANDAIQEEILIFVTMKPISASLQQHLVRIPHAIPRTGFTCPTSPITTPLRGRKNCSYRKINLSAQNYKCHSQSQKSSIFCRLHQNVKNICRNKGNPRS